MGKALSIGILLCALIAGGGMYYLQVYHFYETVTPNGRDDVQMTALASERPEPVRYDDFRAIDADSSPIRYRACFTTSMRHAQLTETFVAYDGAVPLVAPGWFDCFDAGALGAALQEGRALAFLGTRNITYGVDRIVAIHEDGRGWAWHQINRCGAEVFDGNPVPEGCPPPPATGG